MTLEASTFKAFELFRNDMPAYLFHKIAIYTALFCCAANPRVPLHRVQEAVCYLKERVESMPAEVFSASLSDGFAVVNPDSRPEYYNSLGHQQTRRADEQGAPANGEVEKKAKDLDETPFAASSSTLTKRTRAVGS